MTSWRSCPDYPPRCAAIAASRRASSSTSSPSSARRGTSHTLPVRGHWRTSTGAGRSRVGQGTGKLRERLREDLSGGRGHAAALTLRARPDNAERPALTECGAFARSEGQAAKWMNRPGTS